MIWGVPPWLRNQHFFGSAVPSQASKTGELAQFLEMPLKIGIYSGDIVGRFEMVSPIIYTILYNYILYIYTYIYIHTYYIYILFPGALPLASAGVGGYTHIHDFWVWPRIQNMVDGAPISFGIFEKQRDDFTPGVWDHGPGRCCWGRGLLCNGEIPWEMPCFHGGFNGNMSFCMVL